MQSCIPPMPSLMAKGVSASLPIWVPLMQPSQPCGHRVVGAVRENPGFTPFPPISLPPLCLEAVSWGWKMREGLLRGAKGTPWSAPGEGDSVAAHRDLPAVILCVRVCVRGTGSAVIPLCPSFPTQESKIQFPENISEQDGCRRREMPEGLWCLPSFPCSPAQTSPSSSLTHELEKGSALPQAFPRPYSALLSQG